MGSSMSKLGFALCTFLFFAVPDAKATFDVNFLAATCARDTTGLPARTVRTANGVGVTFAGREVGDVILLCQLNVEPGSSFLELRLIAEDNTAGGSATATLSKRTRRNNESSCSEVIKRAEVLAAKLAGGENQIRPGAGAVNQSLPRAEKSCTGDFWTN